MAARKAQENNIANIADTTNTAELMDNTEPNTVPELIETVGAAQEERRIYVGPNIFTRGLLQYQVFIGELPSEVMRFSEERCRQIISLFVPVNELSEAIVSAATPGTILHKYYEIVQDAYSKEVNNSGI